ncbi:hypothetical protein [Halobacillus sp. Nhm2S1]|uniref:hypothetical protein n=1 Tax=Halobacillus sp. Nhm2S1 TaxID=2866716 RepID=UPI001C7341D3|nr:hypothetical protein [Halobacillus sp. Nhm2S1]MBX0358423.1 hypothetical protein [Halobacillus sp. Nhm2S1]
MGINVSQNTETAEGVGLSVSAEEELMSLKKNADVIIHGTLDEDYETRTQVADAENNVYQIDRVYTITVMNNYKGMDGAHDEVGDKIDVVYPVGFKQKEDGSFKDHLLSLSDEIIPIDSGEYILFLDDLDGDFYFSNINHVYKKRRMKNLITSQLRVSQ